MLKTKTEDGRTPDASTAAIETVLQQVLNELQWPAGGGVHFPNTNQSWYQVYVVSLAFSE